MNIALFDSNILIDALNGLPQALAEMHYYEHKAISAITWIEVISKPYADQLSGLITHIDMLMILGFVSTFQVIHTDEVIMAETAALRANSMMHPPKIRLPDAIIQATANVTGYLLVTRNHKDFRGPNIRRPYELQHGQVFNVAAPPAAL